MKSLLLSCFLLCSFTFVCAQNALSFDGTDDKVDIGNGSALQITGNTITIEAWIYPTSWRTNVWEGGIVVKEMNSSNNGYMFRCGNVGRLNFGFGANGLPWKELTTGANTLSLNTWQHVAASYNGSKVRLYVNGIKVDSASYTGNIGNATNNCFIGGYYSTGRNFPGKIDEVRIWNIARTGSQIAAAMNGEFCGAIPGLVAYYKLNQGTAGGNNAGMTTATDAAGNNNGTLQNFALTGSTSNWTTGKSLITPVGGNGVDTVLACGSYTSPSGNHVWTQSGNYIDTINSPLGCDSTVAINLTVNQHTQGVTSVTTTGCNKYNSPSGKYTWTTSGTYQDTVLNVGGCDSALSISLTIKTIDTNVLVGGVTLTSWASGAVYQWLDCNNSYAIMPGANGQSFTPPVSGSYAVAVSKDGCTDTSSCYTVTGIGIDEFSLIPGLNVYPNPAKDFVSIDLGNTYKNSSVKILNMLGQKLLEQEFRDSRNIELKLDLSAGMYILAISADDLNATRTISIK